MAAGVTYERPQVYDNGNGQMAPQFVDFMWMRKALIDVQKEMLFSQMSDTMSMPRHMGKKIKRYHYVPMLDDRNVNDQGIDATGNVTPNSVTIVITDPNGFERRAVGDGTNAATALTAAQNAAVDLFKNLGMTVTTYAALKAALTGLPKPWTFDELAAVNDAGNLYGSSKDVGTISAKLPTISETGGRVNRVGFKRIPLEASICEFGFFEEYTQEDLDFDTDPELMSHISREAMRGANEIVEDCIQIDLLNGANVVFYGGDATDESEITGEAGVTPSILDYDTLVKIDTILNNNHCPKDTQIITGSRMIDTRTVGATRYAYVGSELKSMLMQMKDYHGNPAFIPIHQYAAAGTIANGEIGAVGSFRFIEHPEMMHWDGEGADVTNNDGYMESNGKYNIYPVLIVGSKSFTTIGFYTGSSGNMSSRGEGSKVPVKFKMIHKRPGTATADRNDPYGKVGFYSIQWWYGTAIWRPEWIALVKCVAPR